MSAAVGRRAGRAGPFAPELESYYRPDAERIGAAIERDAGRVFMDEPFFRMPLYLPAQGAAETEATIIEWHVAEGDHFAKGQVLAQIDSAKSVFDFEAPCDGLVIRLLHLEGETVPLTSRSWRSRPATPRCSDWIPPAGGEPPAAKREAIRPGRGCRAGRGRDPAASAATCRPRVVDNAELAPGFPEISEQYVYQVTGIRQRHWASDDEKPSDMAFKASLEAIRKSGIATKDIDAIIVATTTPDVAMPSTACILQDRLCLQTIPAFDLNAACSGWLYAVSMARGMILSGMARNVLTVGVDMQSRLLDPTDRNAYFLFGDGAGAAIISAGSSGHRIRQIDPRGRHAGAAHGPPGGAGLRRRQRPRRLDPWIRIDGHALFRFATESFADLIRQPIAKSGWTPDETSAGSCRTRPTAGSSRRPPSGAASISARFFLNVDHVGNTSSASIPLALVEMKTAFSPATSWSSAPSAPA